MPLNFEIVIVFSYSCAGRTDLCTLDSELSDWLFDLNFRAKESTNQKQFYRSLDSMSKKNIFSGRIFRGLRWKSSRFHGELSLFPLRYKCRKYLTVFILIKIKKCRKIKPSEIFKCAKFLTSKIFTVQFKTFK